MRLPLAMILLGLLVQLGFPDVEDEALPVKKAFEMWGWGAGQLRLDPQTAGWPSLSFYLHLLVQHLHFAFGRLTGAFASREDYFVAAWVDRDSLLAVARALSMAGAAVVIGIGTRLAQRLVGWEGALLSGLLLAFSPLLIAQARLVTPDILLAAFAALAIDRMVAVQQRGRLADSLLAGTWIGLGISTKYTPLLLVPALFVAHAMRRAAPRRRDQGQADPWLALAAAALAFVATSPYVVLDLQTLVRDVSFQTLHMTQGHFGQDSGGRWLFYPRELSRALGGSGLLACIAGLTWAALRTGGPWRVIAACVVPYFIGLAALATQFPRYLLPLLLPLAVGAGGLVLLARRLPALASGVARVSITTLLLMGAVAPAIVQVWREHSQRSRPTTHQLANRYLQQTVDHAGSHVAAEVLSVTLPTALSASDLDPAVLRRLSPSQHARVLARRSYEIDYIPMNSVQPERSAFYYDLRHYVPYDHIVVSEAVRGRYRAEPARFPAQNRFYRDLDHYATSVWRSDPAARGPAIQIYRLPSDSAAALLRDRGPLELAAALDASAPLHMATYSSFVEGVGRAAAAGGDWAMAERYFTLLLDAARSADLPEEDLGELRRVIDDLKDRVIEDKPAREREGS
jgi:hypothetical protein